MIFEDLATKTFYNNTVLEWLIALLFVAGAIIVGKIVYWISGSIVKKAARKTKTKIDDILVDLLEEPAVAIITLIGIYLGINSLTFPDSAINVVDKIYNFLIIFVIAWALTRMVTVFINEYIRPLAKKSNNDLDDQVLPVISKSLKAIIWVLAVIIGLDNAGYDVTALIAGLGVGGLAVALAVKDTLQNIFGGITIFSDKPFKSGDRVKAHGYDGKIEEIGIRSTRLRTLEGRYVTLPNSLFISEPIENVTKEPARKVKMTLGLTYDTKPAKIKKAIDIVNKILKSKKYVDKNKILVEFTSFGDFALGVLVVYWITDSKKIFPGQTEINSQILTDFNKAKIDMAFPTQTVYVKK